MIRRYSWSQIARIVFALGWADFMLKYRGSFLGYLWSLALPALKFAVIYHVFRGIVGIDILRYPLYLLLGLILWEFFARVTAGCIAMPLQKAALIQHIAFPRIALAFAVGWTDTLVFLTHCAVFAAFALVMGVPVSSALLYVPVVFLQTFALFLGMGMIMSAFALRFRDIEHLWTVLLQVFFWLTPVMYRPAGVSLASGKGTWSSLLNAFIALQPVSVLMQDARQAVLFARVPALMHAASVTLLCLLVFGAGVVVFRWRSRYFLQEY